jgi:hypothetical protein
MSGRYKVSLPTNENFNAFAEGVMFKNGRAEVHEGTILKGAKVEEVIKKLEALGFICEPVINPDGTAWDSELEAEKLAAEEASRNEVAALRVTQAHEAAEAHLHPQKKAKKAEHQDTGKG